MEDFIVAMLNMIGGGGAGSIATGYAVAGAGDVESGALPVGRERA